MPARLIIITFALLALSTRLHAPLCGQAVPVWLLVLAAELAACAGLAFLIRRQLRAVPWLLG